MTGVVSGAFKYRVSQLEQRQAAQQAFSQQLIESQEAERKRIALEYVGLIPGRELCFALHFVELRQTLAGFLRALVLFAKRLLEALVTAGQQ